VCNFNQLTSLDVTNNTALQNFICGGNQLTTLDVTNNTALQYFSCISNQLTNLDVSNNPDLLYLNCNLNQLTSLDVSNNTALDWLMCNGNQLSSLDVRNGNNVNFDNFDSLDNPDLTCIYVDDADYSNANWTDIDPNSTFVENEAECEALGESYCKEMNVTRLLDSDNEVVTFEISTDEWHYLAFTKSDDLTGKIYLDGNLVGEGTFLDVDYNWFQLYLGVSYFTSWRKHFKGWLDEFRVSSVVRTEQEILENFEANTSLELDDNTLGLWHLDEPDGNFFNNSVPGMDDGELFSGAQFTDGRFGNSVYFDGIDDRGDCYTNIPESNVTFEIWLKIQGEEEQENVITPFEAYGLYNTSSDVFDNCDLILDGSSTEINSISIYPNPTNNYLFIEGNINPVAISIYNLLGVEVISTKNTDKVDVSELSKGIYIIKISDGKNLTNKKFIKN
ncbi:T9SS type A sorting domain-containing protein, partial [bacterium]|nr:T9SS type A sorting domain-containing protein [bacterium]